MSMSIPKCFSVLVASGNGQVCNDLKSNLRTNFAIIDEKIGISKTLIHKEYRKNPEYKQDYDRVKMELAQLVEKYYTDIPVYFFGPDLKKQAGSN